MKKKTEFQKLHKSTMKKLDSLSKSPLFCSLEKEVRSASENYVFQKSRQESKLYDETWVLAFEEAFPKLDKIVNNPRNFIKEQGEVVLAALAKRVTPASIAHLASHTQFIKKVHSNGDIEPEKILSVHTEEDFQIYENRFVATLIVKLVEFVERRYNYIKEHMDTKNTEVMAIHCVTKLGEVEYEYDSHLKLSRPSDDNGNKDKNDELLERIEKIRSILQYYVTSHFMKNMSGFRPVHNPIAMTNLLTKNPDYRAAYKLWCFLDKYNRLGVVYNVNESNKEFNQEYFDEIYSLVLASLLSCDNSLIEMNELDPATSRSHEIVPKIKLSLEDESFLDRKFAYQEFPALKKADEEKKRLKTPAEIKEQAEKDKSEDWDNDQKIERIREHEEERRRAQEIFEANENARIRKARLKELADWEKKVALEAKKLLLEDLKKEEEKKKALEREAIKKERKLLDQQRKRIKMLASKDKENDIKKADSAERKAANKKISPIEKEENLKISDIRVGGEKA